MKYYPIHTHLHCSHEPTASIGSHISHAKELGIRHLWTSEHDTRMGKKKIDLSVFRFNEKSLFVKLANGAEAGFREEEGSNGVYSFEQTEKGIALRISTKKNEKESLLFYSRGKKHCDPLFSKLTVQMEADIDEQAEIEFVLSAQPPAYQQVKMRYVLGEIPQNEDDLVQYLPFPKCENGVYTFPLYRDVAEEIGGLDNALCNIRITAKNGAELTFYSFSFKRELEFEEVRQEQKKVARKLALKEGVAVFVGFEITGAGNHKNCFSTKVPVIDYEALNYKVSNAQAIEHVKNYGGIFSWNHPFTEYANLDKNKTDIFEEVASNLIKNRVYGASLIEVGFPNGRDGFSAKEYLRLWDRLSEKGIFITGNGDSDNHHAVADGWVQGNNFCSFAGLYDKEEPREENFVKAFKRGSLWSGNPVLINNLSFTGNGKEQGNIIRGGQVCVEFYATGIKCNGYAVCISNGTEIKREKIKAGAVSGTWILENEKAYNFARLEIYNAENVLIAFSNPIYLVDERIEIEERNANI